MGQIISLIGLKNDDKDMAEIGLDTMIVTNIFWIGILIGQGNFCVTDNDVQVPLLADNNDIEMQIHSYSSFGLFLTYV